MLSFDKFVEKNEDLEQVKRNHNPIASINEDSFDRHRRDFLFFFCPSTSNRRLCAMVAYHFFLQPPPTRFIICAKALTSRNSLGFCTDENENRVAKTRRLYFLRRNVLIVIKVCDCFRTWTWRETLGELYFDCEQNLAAAAEWTFRAT